MILPTLQKVESIFLQGPYMNHHHHHLLHGFVQILYCLCEWAIQATPSPILILMRHPALEKETASQQPTQLSSGKTTKKEKKNSQTFALLMAVELFLHFRILFPAIKMNNDIVVLNCHHHISMIIIDV